MGSPSSGDSSGSESDSSSSYTSSSESSSSVEETPAEIAADKLRCSPGWDDEAATEVGSLLVGGPAALEDLFSAQVAALRSWHAHPVPLNSPSGSGSSVASGSSGSGGARTAAGGAAGAAAAAGGGGGSVASGAARDGSGNKPRSARELTLSTDEGGFAGSASGSSAGSGGSARAPALHRSGASHEGGSTDGLGAGIDDGGGGGDARGSGGGGALGSASLGMSGGRDRDRRRSTGPSAGGGAAAAAAADGAVDGDDGDGVAVLSGSASSAGPAVGAAAAPPPAGEAAAARRRGGGEGGGGGVAGAGAGAGAGQSGGGGAAGAAAGVASPSSPASLRNNLSGGGSTGGRASLESAAVMAARREWGPRLWLLVTADVCDAHAALQLGDVVLELAPSGVVDVVFFSQWSRFRIFMKVALELPGDPVGAAVKTEAEQAARAAAAADVLSLAAAAARGDPDALAAVQAALAPGAASPAAATTAATNAASTSSPTTAPAAAAATTTTTTTTRDAAPATTAVAVAAAAELLEEQGTAPLKVDEMLHAVCEWNGRELGGACPCLEVCKSLLAALGMESAAFAPLTEIFSHMETFKTSTTVNLPPEKKPSRRERSRVRVIACRSHSQFDDKVTARIAGGAALPNWDLLKFMDRLYWTLHATETNVILPGGGTANFSESARLKKRKKVAPSKNTCPFLDPKDTQTLQIGVDADQTTPLCVPKRAEPLRRWVAAAAAHLERTAPSATTRSSRSPASSSSSASAAAAAASPPASPRTGSRRGSDSSPRRKAGGAAAAAAGSKVNLLAPDSVVLGKTLAGGHYGKVRLGTWMHSEVACKTITSDADQFKAMMREAETIDRLTKSHHRNIMDLHGIWQDPQNDTYWLVMQLAKGGSLKKRLDTVTGREVYAKTLDWSLQIAAGMQVIASEGFTHSDLRADNVLLADPDGETLLIADFGLARPASMDKPLVYTGAAPIYIYPPEALARKQFHLEKSDMWSYGCLLWECLTMGATPWRAECPAGNWPAGVRHLVLEPEARILRKPVDCPDDFYELLKRTWAYKPADRPTFAEIFDEIASRRERPPVNTYSSSSEDEGPVEDGAYL